MDCRTIDLKIVIKFFMQSTLTSKSSETNIIKQKKKNRNVLLVLFFMFCQYDTWL